MKTTILMTVAALLMLGGGDRLWANLIVSIDQAGMNDPVNVNQSRVWNFGITEVGAAYFAANGMTFDSALFNAKIHKSTIEPIVFSLYSGLGGDVEGNTLLTQIAVPSSEFNQQYSGGLGRLFAYAAQLLTTGYYSVTLTSNAADKANTEYFLKQGQLTLRNSDGTALDSLYWIQDTGVGHAGTTFSGTGTLYNGGGAGNVVLVPEVNSLWAIAGLALASLGGTFVRRFQKKPALARA